MIIPGIFDELTERGYFEQKAHRKYVGGIDCH